MAVSSRKRWLKIVIFLGVLALGWYLGDPKYQPLGQKWGPARYVLGWRGKAAVGVVEYRTNTVARGDIVQSVTANGSLTPVRLVEVGSQVSGIIKDVLVDFNSPVKEGDVIVRIDPATYERALARADADVANARAALEFAVFNAKRGVELFQAKLISETENAQNELSLHQAEANVRMRQASLDSAKVDLERTTIYAPIDGIVITRAIEAGQTLASSFSTPRLFTIANDLAKMQIEAAVSEADIGGVEAGQRVNFTVDAFPARQFRGTVRQVRFAPTTNQNVVTYITVVEVQNPDLKLRPGMTANANIITAEKKNALRIPLSTFRFRPPEGANVAKPEPAPGETSSSGGTNAAPARELATSGPFAGLPIQPWAAERRRPTDEERARYEASLTPEEKEKYQQARDRMRQMMAQGGGGGGGGGSGGSGGGGGGAARGTEGPATRTVYLMSPDPGGDPKRPLLKQVTIKTGISDGATYIEVLEGLKEGDVVVTGTVSSGPMATAQAPAVANPFGGGPPFGGGGGRR